MAPAPLDAVPSKTVYRSRTSRKQKTKPNGTSDAHQPTFAHTTTKPTSAKRAQKRKLDVSDEDDMNDFMPQPRQLHNVDNHQHSSWPSGSYSTGTRHAPIPTSGSMRSIGSHNDPAQQRPVKRFMEEDRGFVFARKRTVAPPPPPQQQPSSLPPEPPRKAANKFLADVNGSGTGTHPPTPERSPSREALTDSRRVHMKASRKEGSNRSGTVSKATSTAQYTGRDLAGPSSSTPLSRSRTAGDHTPTMMTESIVAIPMRETPMIKKNKDMRGDSRRSSFTLRGKRASSIGSGFEAQPHPAIDPKGFYRHISADLPDIARMKQLLAWCGRKSADSMTTTSVKGSVSASTFKIAKAVQEDVLQMLISNNINLSWYHRPQDPKETSSSKTAKKPHKQNVENRRKLREYEEQMAKLKQEDEQWTRLISSYNTFHASILDNGPKLPPGDEPIVFPAKSADDIDVAILTADERRLWEKHCQPRDDTLVMALKQSRHMPRSAGTDAADLRSTLPQPNRISLTTEIDTRWIPEKMKNLESQVDDFRDKLYMASQFNKVARQYTDQVLEQVAVAMEKRQRPPVDVSAPYPLAFTSSAPAPSSSSASSSSSTSSLHHPTTTANGHISLPFPPPPSSTSTSSSSSSSFSLAASKASASKSTVASLGSRSSTSALGSSSSSGTSNTLKTEHATRPPAAESMPDTRDIMRQLSRLCI
ncbi:hypothetical protein BGW42_004868 [Actinomortierella wolfii]|nr:hypothetical protein BGW42_004868 [Actinomortierella wolfii]